MLLVNLPADAETKIVPFRHTTGREYVDTSEFNLTEMGAGWQLVAILDLQQMTVHRHGGGYSNNTHTEQAQVMTLKGALLCRTKNAAEADLARREQITAEVTNANHWKFDRLEDETKRTLEKNAETVAEAEERREDAIQARDTVQAALDAAEASKRKMEADLAKLRTAVGERVWKETLG